MRVRDVMTTDVVTATPDTPFPQLIDLMLRHGVSGLPVVDDERRLVGLVTEADLVSKEAYGGRRRRILEVLADAVTAGESPWRSKARGRVASHVMTRQLVTSRPSDDIRDAARAMVENGVKRLPIVDPSDRLAGIVSRTDLLRTLHRDDDELRLAVRRVVDDPTRAPEGTNLDIRVTDGVVTLTGTASFPHDVEMLTAVVWAVPGVVGVDNDVVARFEEPRGAAL